MSWIKQVRTQVSAEEREKFLTGNPMPVTDAQRYIWWSVQNAQAGDAYLFVDELPVAAEMARRVGLVDLAQRIEGAGHAR